MSLAPFIFDWKRDAWDRSECKQRNDDGNPLEIWFIKKNKVVLKVFITYDANGDWESFHTEKPKPTKKAKKERHYQ